MFGRHFRLPIEQTLAGAPSSNSGELEDISTQLRERQFDAITHVIERQRVARDNQRRRYNKNSREKGFEIGDKVYVFRPATKKGDAAKLTKPWEPGYIVEEKHPNKLTYEVRKPGSGKPREKVHVNRLKPQTESQVYREGQEAARAIRQANRSTFEPKQEPKPGTQRELGQSTVGDLESSSDEEPWPQNPHPLTGRTPQDQIDHRESVTSYESSESDPIYSADEATPARRSAPEPIYAEIDEAQPAAPRRSQRISRPPARYTP